MDQEADALHFRLVDVPATESDEIASGVIVDYDESNQVVGIEVLRLSKKAPASGEPNGFPIPGQFKDVGPD